MNRLEVGDFARALPQTVWTQLGALARAARAADGASFGIIALFALPYVWLIWRYEFLPMQDLSGHVELSFLHHRLAVKDPAYMPFYQIAPQPWPNSLSTLVLSVFGGQLGFERGVKALLSLYALAWPLSLGLLARLLGRSPLVALFALPTILDFNWALGFFNYLLGKPLVVASVCAAIGFSRGPSVLRAALLMTSIWLSFLAHGLAFGLSGIWAGLSVLCFSRGYLRIVNLWPLVLSLVVPLRYVLEQRKVEHVPGGWVFGTWEQMLNTLWHHLGNLNPSDGEESAYLLAFAAWLLTATIRARPETQPETLQTRESAIFLWLSAVVLFSAYGRGALFMPNVDLVSPRILVFAWSLLMILPLALPSDFRRYLVAAFMASAVGVHVYGTSAQYKQFNEVEMGGYSALIDMIPPGKSLAVHFYRQNSPFARENAMWHWPKLYAVRKGRGAHTDDTFAWRSTSYVNLTEAALKTSTYAVPPMLDYNRVRLFDYEISHGGPKEMAIANMAPVADYIASRAEWHLFRVRKE